MSKHARRPFGQRLIDSLNKGVESVRDGRALRTTLVPVPPAPPAFGGVRLKELRGRLGMHQVGMAAFLNVSPKTLESWEQGVRNPNGAALRLLQVIDDPSILGPVAKVVRRPRARKRTA